MAWWTIKCMISIVMFFVGSVFIYLHSKEARSNYSSEIEVFDVDEFPAFGIEAEEEYPSDKTILRIQPILHQTWKDRAVSSRVGTWIKSWSINHPSWQYIFWTDDSARCLVHNIHRYLLPTYDGYAENIRRADAIRYVILYEFGGVYADIDVESLRSLDPIIRKYSCILAQEPYEHPIFDGNFEHLVINAFMACAKKHPFMKLEQILILVIQKLCISLLLSTFSQL
ncbi:hypothetical protein CHS0354_021843 [Potamilus streckersoni]|uniref:Uncharacterized protein n=1 Tax=Potamilus streckersoni TaxID=2493646 RepID=A0AAE0VGY5_9BIVA|nr:hypothetical protein CHS0354_021843 [Potamilus streckersoni]